MRLKASLRIVDGVLSGEGDGGVDDSGIAAVQFTGNDGLVFVEYLLELDFVECGVDVGHECGEVVLVICEGSQDYVPLPDAISFERGEHAVCCLSGGEGDCARAVLKTHLFSQLALSPEEVLTKLKSTLMAASISGRLSGDETTLMKIFLSVSSFWPKA